MAASTRPNVLLITTDQQRYDCVGANGNPLIRTPHLDRLAAEGVRFEHCYVQNPVCMPSRASLITGRYCQNHGVRKNGTPLDPQQPNLAHALLAAGYHTASIGKIHLIPHWGRDYDQPHPSLEYGFRTMLNADEPGCYRDAYLRWVEREHPECLEAVRAPLPVPSGASIPPGYVVTPGGRGLFDGRRLEAPPEVSHSGWVATQSIRFLEARAARARSGDEPFFLHAGIYAPHPPLFAPPPYDTLYDPSKMPLPVRRLDEMDDKPAHFRAAARPHREVPDERWRRAKAFYYGMVSLADAQIGRLLGALDGLGLAETTIVVFTSDHGEALGDHYVTGKGPTNYDCIVRVPLLVRWPAGGLSRGRVVGGLVEHVDVCPTLLEAAGVPAYSGVKGASLLPLARGAVDRGRPDVLIEFRDVKTGFSVKTLRSAEYKYTRSRRGGATEEALFDLEADPHEFRNAAPDPAYAPVIQQFRSRLLDRLQDAEDDLPQPISAW